MIKRQHYIEECFKKLVLRHNNQKSRHNYMRSLNFQGIFPGEMGKLFSSVVGQQKNRLLNPVQMVGPAPLPWPYHLYWA